MKNFLTTKEAAAFIGVSPSTLGNWRIEGRGPAYFQAHPNSTCKYRKEELERWVEERTQRPERDTA